MARISHGAANISGINAQAWAGLSLFLQYSRFSDFIKIKLERPDLADFVLVFQNKRIICESKKYRITYADIREILATIPTVEDADEILIICQELDPDIPKQFENARYFPEIAEYLVKKKHFSSASLAYLPKLKFWQVGKDIDRTAVKALLLHRLGSWVPEDTLEELVSNLLINKIYDRSAEGGEYSKADFDRDLEEYKKRLIEKDDHLAAMRTAEEEARKLLAEISQFEHSRFQADNRLSALAAQPRYHYFALEYLQAQDALPVEQLDRFWQATFGSYYARQVFSIFREKITDAASAKYALGFVQKNTPHIRYRIFDEYRYKQATELLTKILSIAPETEESVADLLMSCYKDAGSKTFYVAHRNSTSDDWVREEIAKSIATLYASSNNPMVQEKIVRFIYATINLTEGRWFRHTNQSYPFLEVLLSYVAGNADRLQELGEEITKHYDLFYRRYVKRTPPFDGWDLFGGGESNFGGTYSLSDSAFVEKLLIPGIASLDEEMRWEFVLSHITRHIKEVSREKPDFYNRAAIPTLLTTFSGGSHEQVALEILADYIKMRRGIPFKADLIYQAALTTSLSTEKKWLLLKIGLDEYGYPISVFMDQLLWQLFSDHYAPAIVVFEGLLDSPEYMNRQTRFNMTIDQALAQLIGMAETFGQGVNLLRKYLASDYFRIHLDSFHAYDLKDIFASVLTKDLSQGIDLLHSLIRNKPTENEQAVFGAVIRDAPESITADMYAQVITPLLLQYQTSDALSQLLSRTETRENLVWFGEKLAKAHRYEQALRIAEFFADDPEPAADSDHDRKILEGDRDSSIETPRGIVPWLLIPACAVEGRPFLERAVSITEKLCGDPSIYIRCQALIGLEALARVRLCKMPKSDEWFMDYSMTQRIEALPFAMLDDARNHYPAVMQRLAGVLFLIRTVSDAQALDIINRFERFGDGESFDNLAAYILFMAEFRERAYDQWPSGRPGVAPFNSEPMKRKLEDVLDNGSDTVRRALAWQLCELPKQAPEEEFERLFNISRRHLDRLVQRYDHPIFESAYRFIEEYSERKFEDCYSLWCKCIKVERPAILEEARKKETTDYTWWPYFDNDKILLKVATAKGPEQFINDLQFLLDYPIEVFMNDLDAVVGLLVTLLEPRPEIEQVFARLIERNPKYVLQYDKWTSSS